MVVSEVDRRKFPTITAEIEDNDYGRVLVELTELRELFAQRDMGIRACRRTIFLGKHSDDCDALSSFGTKKCDCYLSDCRAAVGRVESPEAK